MNSKKCYIAGKIGDLPVAEYTANFDAAKTEVINLGLIPVSPTDLPHNHDKTWASYMREDIIAMMDCGTVYALRNWRFSPGAIVEIELAVKLGLNIIHQPAKVTTVAASPTIHDQALQE